MIRRLLDALRRAWRYYVPTDEQLLQERAIRARMQATRLDYWKRREEAERDLDKKRDYNKRWAKGEML